MMNGFTYHAAEPKARRHYARWAFPYGCVALLVRRDSDPVYTDGHRLIDISWGGARLDDDWSLAAGEIVEVKLVVRDTRVEIIHAKGHVVRLVSPAPLAPTQTAILFDQVFAPNGVDRFDEQAYESLSSIKKRCTR